MVQATRACCLVDALLPAVRGGNQPFQCRRNGVCSQPARLPPHSHHPPNLLNQGAPRFPGTTTAPSPRPQGAQTAPSTPASPAAATQRQGRRAVHNHSGQLCSPAWPTPAPAPLPTHQLAAPLSFLARSYFNCDSLLVLSGSTALGVTFPQIWLRKKNSVWQSFRDRASRTPKPQVVAGGGRWRQPQPDGGGLEWRGRGLESSGWWQW